MTIYAIATVTGMTPTGFKTMRILNCPVSEHVGQVWMNDQNVSEGEPYLVRFEPADQFCTVVDLRNIKEAT